jgi:hypothetical protein
MVCLYVCLCVCLGCFWVFFLGLGVSFKHHADTGKRVYVCVHQCVRAYVCVVCVYEPMYAHASVCMCMRAYVCICECIQEPLCTTSHIFTQTCINLVFCHQTTYIHSSCVHTRIQNSTRLRRDKLSGTWSAHLRYYLETKQSRRLWEKCTRVSLLKDEQGRGWTERSA